MRNNNTMKRMKSKGERPLFCSSNSSSPASSSSSQQRQRQRHNAQFTAAVPQMHIYENQHRRQVGSTSNWLGNNKYECDKEEPEGVNPCNCEFNIGTGAASKLHEEHGRGEESAAAVVVHVIEKEHMFNKVVTPSDVGKLNRLVIPKQHAEKYFPLDSSTNDKGLLLNFEDRNGKSWRFRYSYWSSSQSYVMTKGWSRFVKDKKLDAGDIVSFQRGLGDSGKDRLYIDWRRRPDVLHPSTTTATNYHQCYHHGYGYQQQHPFSSITWSPLLMNPTTPTTPIVPRDPYLSNSPPNINAYYSGGGSYGYGPSCYGHNNYSNAVKINPRSSSLGSTFYNMRSAGAAAAAAAAAPTPEEQQRMAYESVPVIQGKAAAKRLRLFGVNVVCPITDQSHECDVLSSNINTPHANSPLPAQQQ